jgi:hypothetical protein
MAWQKLDELIVELIQNIQPLKETIFLSNKYKKLQRRNYVISKCRIIIFVYAQLKDSQLSILSRTQDHYFTLKSILKIHNESHGRISPSTRIYNELFPQLLLQIGESFEVSKTEDLTDCKIYLVSRR